MFFCHQTALEFHQEKYPMKALKTLLFLFFLSNCQPIMIELTPKEKQLIQEVSFDENVILSIKQKFGEPEQWKIFQINPLFDTKWEEESYDWVETKPVGLWIEFDIKRETMEEGLHKMDMTNYQEGYQKINDLGEALYLKIKTELQESDYQVYIGSKKMTDAYSLCILKNKNPFAPIIQARTDGANYGLEYTDIVKKLEEWQKISEFTVMAAGRTAFLLHFTKLPKDIDLFMQDVHSFCPDIKEAMHNTIYDIGVDNLDKYLVDVEYEIDGKKIESIELTDETLKQLVLDSHRLCFWWD